jgi:hypothetical protein
MDRHTAAGGEPDQAGHRHTVKRDGALRSWIIIGWPATPEFDVR